MKIGLCVEGLGVCTARLKLHDESVYFVDNVAVAVNSKEHRFHGGVADGCCGLRIRVDRTT